MLLNRWLHNIAKCYIIHNTNTKYFESMICKRTIQYSERHAVVFQTRNMNIWSNADIDDWYEIQLGPMNNTEDVRIAFPKLIIASDTIFLIVAWPLNNISTFLPSNNINMSPRTCMWKNKGSVASINKLQIILHTSCHPDWDYWLTLAFCILPSLHRL